MGPAVIGTVGRVWRGSIVTCRVVGATWVTHTLLYEDVVNGREDLLTPCLVR